MDLNEILVRAFEIGLELLKEKPSFSADEISYKFSNHYGSPIPFKRHGFDSLEALLESSDFFERCEDLPEFRCAQKENYEYQYDWPPLKGIYAVDSEVEERELYELVEKLYIIGERLHKDEEKLSFTPEEINDAYRAQHGQPIPYRRHGFLTLVELLEESETRFAFCAETNEFKCRRKKTSRLATEEEKKLDEADQEAQKEHREEIRGSEAKEMEAVEEKSEEAEKEHKQKSEEREKEAMEESSDSGEEIRSRQIEDKKLDEDDDEEKQEHHLEEEEEKLDEKDQEEMVEKEHRVEICGSEKKRMDEVEEKSEEREKDSIEEPQQDSSLDSDEEIRAHQIAIRKLRKRKRASTDKEAAPLPLDSGTSSEARDRSTSPPSKLTTKPVHSRHELYGVIQLAKKSSSLATSATFPSSDAASPTELVIAKIAFALGHFPANWGEVQPDHLALIFRLLYSKKICKTLKGVFKCYDVFEALAGVSQNKFTMNKDADGKWFFERILSEDDRRQMNDTAAPVVDSEVAKHHAEIAVKHLEKLAEKISRCLDDLPSGEVLENDIHKGIQRIYKEQLKNMGKKAFKNWMEAFEQLAKVDDKKFTMKKRANGLWIFEKKIEVKEESAVEHAERPIKQELEEIPPPASPDQSPPREDVEAEIAFSVPPPVDREQMAWISAAFSGIEKTPTKDVEDQRVAEEKREEASVVVVVKEEEVCDVFNSPPKDVGSRADSVRSSVSVVKEEVCDVFNSPSMSDVVPSAGPVAVVKEEVCDVFDPRHESDGSFSMSSLPTPNIPLFPFTHEEPPQATVSLLSHRPKTPFPHEHKIAVSYCKKVNIFVDKVISCLPDGCTIGIDTLTEMFALKCYPDRFIEQFHILFGDSSFKCLETLSGFKIAVGHNPRDTADQVTFRLKEPEVASEAVISPPITAISPPPSNIVTAPTVPSDARISFSSAFVPRVLQLPQATATPFSTKALPMLPALPRLHPPFLSNDPRLPSASVTLYPGKKELPIATMISSLIDRVVVCIQHFKEWVKFDDVSFGIVHGMEMKELSERVFGTDQTLANLADAGRDQFEMRLTSGVWCIRKKSSMSPEPRKRKHSSPRTHRRRSSPMRRRRSKSRERSTNSSPSTSPSPKRKRNSSPKTNRRRSRSRDRVTNSRRSRSRDRRTSSRSSPKSRKRTGSRNETETLKARSDRSSDAVGSTSIANMLIFRPAEPQIALGAWACPMITPISTSPSNIATTPTQAQSSSDQKIGEWIRPPSKRLSSESDVSKPTEASATSDPVPSVVDSPIEPPTIDPQLDAPGTSKPLDAVPGTSKPKPPPKRQPRPQQLHVPHFMNDPRLADFAYRIRHLLQNNGGFGYLQDVEGAYFNAFGSGLQDDFFFLCPEGTSPFILTDVSHGKIIVDQDEGGWIYFQLENFW